MKSRLRGLRWFCYVGAFLLITLIVSAIDVTASEGIVNGGTEVTQSGAWPWMVGVDIDENGSLFASCSGAMIGPTTVITAAHCVDPAELGFTPTPADILVTADRDLESAPSSDFIAVTSFVENPSFSVNDLDAGHDESVLQLATQPPGTTPIPVLQPADLAPFSQSFNALVAGYGLTVPDNDNSAGVLYQTEVANALYGVGDISVSSNPAYTCFGDSGGPLIVNLDSGTLTSNPTSTNGSWAIIGLTSYGDSSCEFFDDFTNVVSDYSFLSSQDPYIATGPINSIAPQVSGNPFVGSKLTCDSGIWANNPTLSYQWQTTGNNGAAIAGATGSSYVPTTSEVGETIACQVDATASGETIVADAAPVTIAAAGAPVLGGKLKLSRSHAIVTVAIRCDDVLCGGSSQLTEKVNVRVRHGSHWLIQKKTVDLSSSSFSLAQNERGVMRFRLTKLARQTLARSKTPTVSVVLTEHPFGGTPVSHAGRISLS